VTDNISELKNTNFWELELKELKKICENNKKEIKKYLMLAKFFYYWTFWRGILWRYIKTRKEFETSFNAVIMD